MQTMAKCGKNNPPLRHEWQKTKVDKNVWHKADLRVKFIPKRNLIPKT